MSGVASGVVSGVVSEEESVTVSEAGVPWCRRRYRRGSSGPGSGTACRSRDGDSSGRGCVRSAADYPHCQDSSSPDASNRRVLVKFSHLFVFCLLNIIVYNIRQKI